MNEKQKATQFGAEKANPSAAQLGMPCGSKIRGNYARLAAMELNLDKFLMKDSDNGRNDAEAVLFLAKRLAGNGRNYTGGHIVAAKQYWKAIKGHEASVTRVEDSVDGKIPETLNINTVDHSKEKLTPEMSRAYFEELERINNTVLKQLTNGD